MANLNIDTGPPEGLGARFVDRPKPKKPRPWLKFAVGLVLAFLAGVWMANDGDDRPAASEPASPSRWAVGQVVTIGTGDPWEGAAHLAVSRDAYQRLIDLAVEAGKGDETADRYLQARNAMIESGEVFTVRGGTSGRIEEDAGSCVRVLVLEGEKAGMAGWIAAPWARALPR